MDFTGSALEYDAIGAFSSTFSATTESGSEAIMALAGHAGFIDVHAHFITDGVAPF